MSTKETIATWSDKVAGLGVDMLVYRSLIKKADFERATNIVAEEIRMRFGLGDYPSLEKE